MEMMNMEKKLIVSAVIVLLVGLGGGLVLGYTVYQPQSQNLQKSLDNLNDKAEAISSALDNTTMKNVDITNFPLDEQGNLRVSWTRTTDENASNYMIVDVPLGIAPFSSSYNTISVNNSTDFRACVNLLEGSDAVVFKTYLSHYIGSGQYGVTLPIVTVYFFPYQGYLIVYYEPQE